MRHGDALYRGYPAIPCTGIGSSDYIFGSYGRLKEALEFVGDRTQGPVAVICSPGASLIGDDCLKAISESGMEERAFVIGEDTMSSSLSGTFDETIARILEFLVDDSAETVPGTVNLLGLSLLAKDWMSVIADFSEIFGRMGLTTISSPGAGSSSEAMAKSVQAEFNIMLCPEYAGRTSRFYESFGVETVTTGLSPVGFAATEELVMRVAEVTGRDPSGAMEYIGRYKRRAHICMESSAQNIKGRTFKVETDPSVACSLTRWLYDDLGLVPVSVLCDRGTLPAEILSGFLDERGFEGVFGCESAKNPYYSFCDGNTAQLEELSGVCHRGVDIMFPSKLNVDFRPSPIFGPTGAMYLLDRIVNPYSNRRGHPSLRPSSGLSLSMMWGRPSNGTTSHPIP